MANKVGYMGPDAAPFRCSNCVHYQDKQTGSGCDDREVIEALGKGKNGLAPVSPDGCCNEFKPQAKRGFGRALAKGIIGIR